MEKVVVAVKMVEVAEVVVIDGKGDGSGGGHYRWKRQCQWWRRGH
jgi:hypothetical protein